MKMFFWGIFFCTLPVVLLIFPESVFSTRIRDLAIALAISIVPLIPFVAPFVPGAIQTLINEKVKGLANKQDIEKLTRKVEEVRLEYRKDLEDHKTKNQLRLAAVDKRLKAHQEAYALVAKCLEPRANIKHLSKECGNWWMENCLYLAPEARIAVLDTFTKLNYVNSLSVKWSDMAVPDMWESANKAAETITTAVGFLHDNDQSEYLSSLMKQKNVPRTKAKKGIAAGETADGDEDE